MPIAQLRYEGAGSWTLYFGDRYGSWTLYSDLEPRQPIDAIMMSSSHTRPASSGA